MLSDFFLFSLKNLRTRKVRSWLTLLGIFIGIAAVVSLIGLGEGLRSAITGQFGFLGADVLSVQAQGINFAGPPGTGVATPLKDDLINKIAQVDGVEASFNRYIEGAPIEFNDRQIIGFLASIPEGNDRKVFEMMVNLKTSSGRLLKDGDNKRILVGADFAEEDTFGKGIRVGDKILVKETPFEVVGILEKKGSFIFDGAFYLNENALLDLFGDTGTTDIIAVKVKDEQLVNQVQADLERLLRKERDVKEGEEDFVVESPQATLDSLNSILFGVQLFIYVIAGISLLVGGLGIMNTMYTSVLERTKEIGVMKSIGARNSNVFLLFFIESGMLGMVGGVIGILLGLALAYGLAAIGKLALGSDLIQAQVSVSLVLGSLAFSFGLGTFFGVLPAYRASKLTPVESLRSAK